jgi:outer membrane protein
MKTQLNLLITAVAILLVTNTSAQQKAPMNLSLKQAQEYALVNNANMKNAKLDIEIAKKKIWETKAMGLPQVSASGSYQHIFKVPVLSFPSTAISDKRNVTTYSASPVGSTGDSVYLSMAQGAPIELGVKNNATLEFNVSQLIFSGEYIVGLQATKVFFQISQNSLQQNTEEMKETVANSYYMIMVVEKNKEILEQSYGNLAKTLMDMKEMNKQGFIEDTDVDQIELTLLILENGIKTLGNQVAAANDLLKFQMGLPFETEINLTEELENVISESDLATIISKKFQVENNISYKMMENQEEVGILNLKRQKSAYLPSLAAFYMHTEKARQADFDFTMKDIAGLSLQVPIFSSGMRNVMVKQRVMELDKIRNSKAYVAQGLELDFINSRNTLTSAYDKYLNEKRNIELTERIYNKTLIKYKEGVSSSMEVTTAQNQYLTAQTNYFTALYSLVSSKNKLEKLLNLQD